MADKTELNLARIRAYDEDIWRTIRGAKVLIEEGTGEIKGGMAGKWNGKKFKPSFGKSLKTGKKVLLPSIHTKFTHHTGSKADLFKRLKKAVEPPKSKSKDEVWQAYQKVDSAKAAIWASKTSEDLEQALKNYNDAVQEYLPIYNQLDKSTLTAGATYWADPASYELNKANHGKVVEEYGADAYEFKKKQIQKNTATEKAKEAWKKVVKCKTAINAAKTKDGKIKNQKKLQDAFDEYKAAKQGAPAGWKIDFKPKESSVEALLAKTPQDFMLEALEKKLTKTEKTLTKGLTNQKTNANMSTTQALNQLASAAKAPSSGMEVYSPESGDFAYVGSDGFNKTPIKASAKEAHDMLKQKCGDVWSKATDEQKEVARDYTGSYYYPLNQSLRMLGNAKMPLDSIKAGHVKQLESLINKSTYDFDIQVRRGVYFSGAAKLLKIDEKTLKTASVKDLQDLLVGRKAIEYGFCSTGVAKGKGFNKDVQLNILCPAGTKMLYAEPFSKCGHGHNSESWDGKHDNVLNPSKEQEAILQRGSKFVVSGVRRSGGVLHIDVQVVSQNPEPLEVK